jgi:hypothetical protein
MSAVLGEQRDQRKEVSRRTQAIKGYARGQETFR